MYECRRPNVRMSLLYNLEVTKTGNGSWNQTSDGLSMHRKAACFIEIWIPSTLISVTLGKNHFCTRIKTAGTEQFYPAMSKYFSDDGSFSFNTGIDTKLLKMRSFTSLHSLKIRFTNSLHFTTISLTWTVWAEVPDKIWNQTVESKGKLKSWKWRSAKTPNVTNQP